MSAIKERKHKNCRGETVEERVEIRWKYRWLNSRKGWEEMEGKRLTHLLAENKCPS